PPLSCRTSPPQGGRLAVIHTFAKRRRLAGAGRTRIVSHKETKVVAQKGKDLLLKLDSNGLGSFTTVARLRTKKLAFTSETVDISDADSAGRWRELLAGSGVRRAALSGAGIFKDATSD